MGVQVQKGIKMRKLTDGLKNSVFGSSVGTKEKGNKGCRFGNRSE